MDSKKMKGKVGKKEYPKPAKISKKWGNNKENLLLAFEFEVSQMMKSQFLDSRNTLVHKFQRDYTEYLNQDDICIYAQKKFGFPQQKLKLVIIHILINELKTVIHEVTADLINDFLFKNEKNNVVMLEKVSGSLQMKIPRWNTGLDKDILPAIIAIESRVTKEDVCTILSLPPPVDKSKPHGLLLSIRMQDDRGRNPQWRNIGTVTVPNDESITEIEHYVTSLHYSWKKKYVKSPSIAPTEEEEIQGDYDGWAYFEIEDKFISIDLETEAFAADRIQEKEGKLRNKATNMFMPESYPLRSCASTSSSSVNSDTALPDGSNELEFDQKIRKSRKLWQDIVDIERGDYAWLAPCNENHDEKKNRNEDGTDNRPRSKVRRCRIDEFGNVIGSDTDDENEDNKDDQSKEINNKNSDNDFILAAGGNIDESGNWIGGDIDDENEDEDNKDEQSKKINNESSNDGWILAPSNESSNDNCSNSDNDDYSEDDYYSDTDLIAEKTTELYNVFGGFVEVSFPLSTLQFDCPYERKCMHPIVGSHRELIKKLRPDRECIFLDFVTKAERSRSRVLFYMRYKEIVAICDALPTLEETYYMPAQEILDTKHDRYCGKERYRCELNFSKSYIKFEITVVGRKERIEKERYPELNLDSKSCRVLW